MIPHRHPLPFLNFMKHTTLRTALIASIALACTAAQSQEKVLNVYSARHYQSDESLYANFTKATGITINRVDTDDAGLLARLKAEGSASPADVVLMVDASRMSQAEADGMFQPVKSALLEQRIPATLRGRDTGAGPQWFGLSTRARVIVYNKATVARDDADTYEELGDPKNKGRVCTRTGSHPYNLTLFGAMLEHQGPQATEAWLKGVVDNMARAPKGGDTDQIRAVASGECAVVLSNSYYVARLMRSEKPEDKAVMEKVAVVYPNQQSWGTHVNIAGGAVARHATHRAEAVKFLEYLASDEAQSAFANGNNEWPAVTTIANLNNPALAAMGPFKAETVPVATAAANQAAVQKMLDRVSYK